tara:strand:- start:2349 stop:2804 length:456 start_codon:yes stop_codon:yes gene_type:complete
MVIENSFPTLSFLSVEFLIFLKNCGLCSHIINYTSVKNIVNLIIVSQLVDTPPSDVLALRHITMVSKLDLYLGVLLEVEQEMKDPYFYYMKKLGLMDCVDEYVTPEEKEEGIRLDTELNYPLTIKRSSIRFPEVNSLLTDIKSLVSWNQSL